MNRNPLLDNELTGNGLQLNANSKEHLRIISGWTRFLAIAGFIMAGLVAVISFFPSILLSAFAGPSGMPAGAGLGIGVVFTVVYLIYAALIFFPSLFLFRFSSKTKVALEQENTMEITEGFKNLKNYYVFTGVLWIIGLGFFLLGIVITILGANTTPY